MKKYICFFTLVIGVTISTQAQSNDTIQLPYTADFTHGWTAENGATIIDANHAAITCAGQKITSPWMESAAGTAFLDWAQQREGEVNYDYGNEEVLITVEDENGVVQNWTDYAGGWSILSTFTSSGGHIRISFEYIGTSPVPSFQIGDVAIYNYQIETSLEGPDIARVGDTVTFISHATLQNNDSPDYYSWYIYKYTSEGSSWIDENDPSRTIISRTDSTLVVVWNTPGRFSVTSSVDKYDVYLTHSAYTTDYQYINIVDHPFYTEDSIYYTSEAKDTVMGCHSQLHIANLPESVRFIADSAFFNLTNLSSVSLPDGLEHVGKMAFAQNQGITEITLPRGLQYVGDNAFWGNTNLAVVNFNADSCTTMCVGIHDDNCFYPVFIGCNNLSTVNIGENVKYIPAFAFSNCNNLQGLLTIPDAVTYIGRDAFYHWDEGNTSQWEIVIGANVSEIGPSAFACHAGHIASVTLRNPVPPVAVDETGLNYAFWCWNQGVPLTVPCGSAEAYSNNAGWIMFDPIVEDCTGIEDTPNDDIIVTAVDGNIIVCGAEHETVTVYDMMGRQVASIVTIGKTIRMPVPGTGIYMVCVGGLPAKRMIIIK